MIICINFFNFTSFKICFLFRSCKDKDYLRMMIPIIINEFVINIYKFGSIIIHNFILRII
jgi:hypothetical protein